MSPLSSISSCLLVYGAIVVSAVLLSTKEVESRLPPKFLKVASSTGKALYARGYGYNVIPIPQKILLQANFAKRVVHGRPPRRTKRPPRRKLRPPPDYASRYPDHRPGRKRPRYPEPKDYRDHELEEELEYDETSNSEYEDFVSKPSGQYSKGYSRQNKPKRQRDEEGSYSESSQVVFARRPPKNWRSTKLYSAAIGARPQRQRQEDKYEEEEADDYYRKESKRGRLREKDKYREREEDANEEYEYSPYRNSATNWHPDEVYHDRKYEESLEPFRSVMEGNDRNKRIVIGSKWVKPEQSFGREGNKESLRPWGSRDKSRPNTGTFRWSGNDEENRWQTQKDVRWRRPVPSSNTGWRQEEDPDIITSQDLTTARPLTAQTEDWVKEHSVGYGIEMDGGQKKKRAEPDVIYGEAGSAKPRIPDIGYGHGLELIKEQRQH